MGVYADDGSNDPGTLLAQGTLSAPLAGAWNSVTIPATALTAGTQYWIAVLAPSGDGLVAFRDGASGGKDEVSAVGGLSSLPTTWSGGTVFSNGPLSAYLSQAGAPPTATSYGYDPVGNRLSKNGTSYTYDRADRILTAGSLSDTVNANGNLTNRGPDTFAYDQANRLTSATVSGVTSTDSYDGDGKRASQTTGTTTTNYVYDINTSLPDVLTDGTFKYVYGLGLAYAVDGSGNVQVYHTDGLGSVRAITNGSGTLIQTYQTDEFGIPTQSSGTSTQPFGFTGQQVDGNGLVYLRARYYDPGIGRFLNRDEFSGLAGVPSSLNRYLYALDNPATAADPTGRASSRILGPIVPQWSLPVGENAGDGVSGGAIAECLADPVCAAVVGVGGISAYLSLWARSGIVASQPSAPEPDWIVRGGIATAKQLQVGTTQHALMPGLNGFSVQYAPGRSIQQLAAAGRFPNASISVTTVEQLEAAAAAAG
ncbi:MAG: RHS repeat-associated core domain-containing protein, partial [Chloroflexota bacterium]